MNSLESWIQSIEIASHGEFASASSDIGVDPRLRAYLSSLPRPLSSLFSTLSLTMKAVVVQPDKSIKVEEKPKPIPGPNEVMLVHVLEFERGVGALTGCQHF